MQDMDRREFLLAALGGVGLLGAAGALGGGAAWAESASPIESAVALRKNVYCLTATSRDMVSYKKGIEVMRSRPATDPTSWLAQANIHGAFSPPAGMIANACEHGSTFFLSWHRMYLHFFERMVRKASGDPAFALPYWGYSPTGQRDLPAPFRLPADATNPLFVSQRRATINGGASLTASTVDPGPALLSPAFFGFSAAVSATPHGVVHTGVGGPGGWMSEFETAGQDPIFWLHHANIDRLWEMWLASGSGHANPTGDANWMGRKFDFYDENGATVSLTGAQVVDTAAQLSYRYAWTGCIQIKFDPRLIARLTRLRPFPPPELVRIRPPVPPRPPLPDPVPLARLQERFTLGAGPAQVRLPVNPDQRRRLATLEEPGAQGQLMLVLEDIRLDRPPNVYYEVYLNLPKAGADTVYTGPHYVGNLDFFGPSPKGPHGKAGLERKFDVVPAFMRLRSIKQWREDTLQVTFVPRGFTEGEMPERLLGKEPQAQVGRIELRLE
jgi:hypothetical protein